MKANNSALSLNYFKYQCHQKDIKNAYIVKVTEMNKPEASERNFKVISEIL